MLIPHDTIIPSRVSRINFIFDNALIFLLAFLVFNSSLEVRHFYIVLFSSVGIWSLSMLVLRYYDSTDFLSRMDDLSLVCITLMVLLGSHMFIDLVFFQKSHLASSIKFLSMLGATTAFFRLAVFQFLYSTDKPVDHVVVVGCDALGQSTIARLKKIDSRTHIAGLYSLEGEENPNIPNVKYFGDVYQLYLDLHEMQVDRVYFAASILEHQQEIQSSINICEQLGIPFSLPAQSFQLTRSKIVSSQKISDGYLHFTSYELKTHQLASKRLLDIALSLSALIFLTPLFLIVSLIIKLTSKGPIFFFQERVGMRGRPFSMIKFRSMCINADAIKEQLLDKNEQSGPVFKMKNDPRITTIGRFIRKFSIDELPQLFNVLRGDMSLVGPRPPVPAEVKKYKPWQKRRLSVRPGLTCYWQVSGRNEIGFEEWMYLDMRYIDHWNLFKDIRLILKTFPVVLFGKGAS